jgi:hypothetical protein
VRRDDARIFFFVRMWWELGATIYTSTLRLARSMIRIILAVMLWLAPGRDHAALASAIEAETGSRMLPLVLSVAFNESGFRADVAGDCPGIKAGDACPRERGKSFCAMQLNGERYRYTLDDPRACIREGVKALEVSLSVCREHPPNDRLAYYARGSCESEEGQRISRHRFALARKISDRMALEKARP